MEYLIYSKVIAMSKEAVSFDVRVYKSASLKNESIAFANVVVNEKEELSISMIVEKGPNNPEDIQNEIEKK